VFAQAELISIAPKELKKFKKIKFQKRKLSKESVKISNSRSE